MIWLRIGQLEIIPEEIWAQNEEYRKHMRIRRAQEHFSVTEFYYEEGIF